MENPSSYIYTISCNKSNFFYPNAKFRIAKKTHNWTQKVEFLGTQKFRASKNFQNGKSDGIV